MSQEPSLPLAAWDDALGPVRRGLIGARQGGDPRWLPAIALPRLDSLPRDGVPDGVLEWVDGMRAAIAALPEVHEADRTEVIASAWQGLCRVDAVLGLPMPRSLSPRVRRVRPADVPETAPAPARSETARADSGRGEPARTVTPREVIPRAAPPMPPPPPLPPHVVTMESRFEGSPFSGAVVEALALAGIETVGDLLAQVPATMEALAPVHGAGRLPEEGRVACGGRVVCRWIRLRPGQGPRYAVRIMGAGPTVATFATEAGSLADRLRPLLPLDARVVLVGTVQPDGTLADAEVSDDSRNEVHLATYGIAGVDEAEARLAVAWSFGGLSGLRDVLPSFLIDRWKTMSYAEALRGVHRHPSAAATQRMAIDELAVASAGLAWARLAPGRERGLAHALQHEAATLAFARAGMTLSDAATAALETVKRDLRRPVPMRRVLWAEPGAGKAAIATWATLAVAETKAQVAWVVEDAAAAELRLGTLAPLLESAGLVGRLLVGHIGQGARDAVKKGEVHVVIATADVFDADLEFRRLGLVVASERSGAGGTAQCLTSWRAGSRPDLLVLGAGPLSWNLLVAAYGDHDVTTWTEPALGPVRTDVHTEVERSVAYASAGEVVASGRQALVVFPLVGGHDALDVAEAQGVVQMLEGLFPGKRLALFHGALGVAQRAQVLEDMSRRKVDVVVATTRIEDGQGLPGLGAIVVEQADRFDPLRLDTLRGLLRATRAGGRMEWVAGDPAEVGRLRHLAQEGPRPPSVGAPPVMPPPLLRWAKPERDLWWPSVRDDILAILAEDPGLRRHGDLARMIRARWSDLWPEDDDASPACPVGEAPAGGERRKRRRRRRR